MNLVKDDLKTVANSTADDFLDDLWYGLTEILGEALDPDDRDARVDYLKYRTEPSINTMRETIIEMIEECVPDNIRYSYGEPEEESDDADDESVTPEK